MATKQAAAKASAKQRKAAQRPPATALRASELDALNAAQRRYVGWRTSPYGVAPMDRSKFTSLREAASAMRKALAPFVIDDLVDTDAARLLALVQEAEGFTAGPSTYRAYLVRLLRVLALLEAACSVMVTRRTPIDEPAYLWVCFAADELLDRTGRRPTPAALARALAAFAGRHPALPALTERDVKAALTAWSRSVQGDSPPKRTMGMG
jgi:hypothetical protein